ncbi:MAG: hypothetical protein M3179_11005 [Actinomycetota bacterium]|nr:hypothetical protein [Actinomycetota bacterium]
MARGFIQADSFELRGPAHITYDLRSGMLHYRGPTRPPLRDFVEVSEIAPPLETPIGRLVTATLRSAEDGDSSAVSILLPEVNLSPGEEQGSCIEAEFEAVAVFTTIRSSIGGPGLVEGPIHLHTHAGMQGTARRGGSAAACVFSASLNFELPGPGGLRVEGECTFGTAGYTVELVRHEPQGINPRDLLLDLIVTPPPPGTVVAQVLTTYQVFYEEETAVHLDTVTILPDGPSVPVQTIS